MSGAGAEPHFITSNINKKHWSKQPFIYTDRSKVSLDRPTGEKHHTFPLKPAEMSDSSSNASRQDVNKPPSYSKPTSAEEIKMGKNKKKTKTIHQSFHSLQIGWV